MPPTAPRRFPCQGPPFADLVGDGLLESAVVAEHEHMHVGDKSGGFGKTASTCGTTHHPTRSANARPSKQPSQDDGNEYDERHDDQDVCSTKARWPSFRRNLALASSNSMASLQS